MNRTTGSLPTRVRVAFYGRTNLVGEQAATEVCRQFRACTAVAGKLGAITQWFYDAPHASGVVSAHMLESDNQLGPPTGGCGELTTAIYRSDREFHVVICAVADRLPRQPRLRHPLLRAVREADMPLVFADELSVTRQSVSNSVAVRRFGIACLDWPACR